MKWLSPALRLHTSERSKRTHVIRFYFRTSIPSSTSLSLRHSDSEKPIVSAGQSDLGGGVEGQHYEAYMVMHVMSDEEQEAVWEMI
jgi:hypothetical protein